LLAAFVAALRGEHETARRVIREAVDDHPRGRGDWSLWGIWLYAGRVACAAGRADDLREALDAMRRLRTGAQALPTFDPPTRVLQANLAMFEGRADAAIQAWQDALDDEPRIDRLGLGIETRVRLAAALLQAGRLDDAAIGLRPVFPRLAEHGGVGVLQMTRSLLSTLATAPWGERLDGQALVWLGDWAQRFGNALPAAPPATPSMAAVTPRPAGLSEREFAVLERIAQGDSNKLIARAFDLSPHTVKRHVANILDKLGVTSRGQAAAWFRALA
jgi:LuxR family transcriptional regulator, maltose regulon positive regulatory protein